MYKVIRLWIVFVSFRWVLVSVLFCSVSWLFVCWMWWLFNVNLVIFVLVVVIVLLIRKI